MGGNSFSGSEISMCKGPGALVHERNRKKPERVDRPRVENSGTRGRESSSIMFDQSLDSTKSGTPERKQD